MSLTLNNRLLSFHCLLHVLSCNESADKVQSMASSRVFSITSLTRTLGFAVFNTSGLSNSTHELVISTDDLPYSAYDNFNYAIYMCCVYRLVRLQCQRNRRMDVPDSASATLSSSACGIPGTTGNPGSACSETKISGVLPGTVIKSNRSHHRLTFITNSLWILDIFEWRRKKV